MIVRARPGTRKGHEMGGGKKGCLICFVIAGVLALLAYPAVRGTYNQLRTLDAEVQTTWAHLESQLQRRMDLIPNYVETVKSYAPQEQAIYGAVTQLHVKAAVTMLRSNKIAVNNELTAALDHVRVATERYPDLKADQTFVRLQDELADIENRIAEECIQYNGAVEEYNAYREGFPAYIVAPLSGFGKAFPLEAPGMAQDLPRSGSEPSPPASSDR
jgi:LemA protein